MSGEALSLEQATESLLTDLGSQLGLESGAASRPARVAAVRQRLKGKPHLVIIDNLESEAVADYLLNQLVDLAEPSRFLLTTRTHPAGQAAVRHFSLPELSLEDASQLLRHHAAEVGVLVAAKATDEEIERIYQVIGGNPLALKLVVGLLELLPLDQVLVDLARSRRGPVEEMYRHIYWQTWLTLSEPAQRLLQAMPIVARSGGEVAAATFDFVLAHGYWAEWLQLMERAGSGYPERPTAARFWVLTRLGQLRRLNHKVPAAIDAHHEALDVAGETGEPLLVAEAHYHLGRALRDAHLGQRANEHLQDAVQILEQVEGEYAQRLTGLVLNALGLVAHDQGRFAEACEYLERSVAIARAVKRTYPLSERLMDLGNLYRSNGMYEDALAAYEEAISLLPASEYPLDRLQIQYCVGVLHFDQGDYAKAEQTFRGLDWAFLRDTLNLTRQAWLTTSLGNSVLYQRRYEEAAEVLRQAVTLWKELGDDLELANATGGLGEAFAGMGEKEEAGAMFARALQLLGQYPDSSMAARLRPFFSGEQAKLAEQGENGDRTPAPPVPL